MDWSKADTVAGRPCSQAGSVQAGTGGLALSPLQFIVKEVTAKSERRGSIFIALRFRTTSPADLRFTTASHRKGRRREKRKAWINIFYKALRFRTNSLAGFSWYVRKNSVD